MSVCTGRCSGGCSGGCLDDGILNRCIIESLQGCITGVLRGCVRITFFHQM